MAGSFDDIRSLYERIDRHLAALGTQATQAPGPSSEEEPVNSCGTCFECCRYSFYLSRYEYEYLEDFVQRHAGCRPAEWVTCTSAEDDPRLDPAFTAHERCAFYQEGLGCMGYEARPLACRTLGPMLPSHSKLPPWCIYKNPEVYHTCEDLPGWSEYAQILRAHYPSPPGYFRPRPAPVVSAENAPDEGRARATGAGPEA